MKSIGIIPARYHSTRFPGKPLALIGHKSMIRRVYEKARFSRLDEVVIATDDERIKEHAMEFGAQVVMTSPDIPNGTIRCYNALKMLNLETDVVVNVQGDEPFIDPAQINALLDAFEDKDVQIATLADYFISREDLESESHMKIVTDARGFALYFSRSVIPFCRDIERNEWLNHFDYLKHIGIYAFRKKVFEEVVHLPEASIERAESLEQLRWLYHGYSIKVIRTRYQGISIDTPEDLEKANELLNTLYE